MCMHYKVPHEVKNQLAVAMIEDSPNNVKWTRCTYPILGAPDRVIERYMCMYYGYVPHEVKNQRALAKRTSQIM